MSTNVNFLTWNDEQRRTSSVVVLGAAVAVALLGVALWYFLAATPAWVYWLLVGTLAAVLIFMAALLFVPARAAAPAAEAPVTEQRYGGPVATSETGGVTPVPAPAFEPRVLTLRCGDCGTIFDLTDTGERPLYHTCPGCGAEGALRDEPIAAEAPASALMASPEAAPPVAEQAPPQMAEADVVVPPVRKMKLRCGGCKEVFSIEDSGERPLKRACPHCGRMGQIN